VVVEARSWGELPSQARKRYMFVVQIASTRDLIVLAGDSNH